MCKQKVLDALTIWWLHLGLPRDVQLQDQEGNAQAFLEPQEKTACRPWLQPSFDMLILQFPRNASHLRLNNLSMYIHTRDLPYPRATLPVLIPGLQGSALCIGNDGGAAAAAAAWGDKSSGAHYRQRKASPTVNDKPRRTREQNTESSFALSVVQKLSRYLQELFAPPSTAVFLSLKAPRPTVGLLSVRAPMLILLLIF